MIRYLRYGFLALLGIVLIILALTNRAPVTITLLPGDLPGDLAAMIGAPYQITVPLFAALFAMIALGVLIGFIWEWFREHKYRAAAARQTKEARRAKKELELVKREGTEPQDDVMALLEAPKKAS